ncbi:MAG: alpha/beta hydrolase-fold protein [Bryobacteraceae bacterium]
MRTLLTALCLTTLALGQALISPEVHPDHRVTFRLAAPKAAEAAFYGDWMQPGTSQKMTRSDTGVWTATVGPLKPSIYIYNFILDGLAIADPTNPRIKLRARTSASLVEVKGATPSLWDATDVPHGAVEINWQKSKVLGGDTRWIWVYTPPNYSGEPRRQYPVLYLFHGSNDIAGGWTLAGNANFILDNLIAQQTAKPMIVVMPFGHAVPFDAPREQQAKNTQLYDDYVMQDVIPFI